MVARRLRSQLNQTQTEHFTQADLAARWRMSERTLERWRWLQQGPTFLKLGGRVVYTTEDILAFEAAQRRTGEV